MTRLLFYYVAKSNMSGAQKNIYHILKELNNDKEVLFICSRENELTRELEAIGVNVKICPLPKNIGQFEKKALTVNLVEIVKRFRSLLRYNKDTQQYITEFAPDYIWFGNIRSFLTLIVAGKKSRSKLIWNIWSEPKGVVFKVLHVMGSLFADEIHLEYAKQLKNLLPNWLIPHRKIKVVNTGVQLPVPKKLLSRKSFNFSQSSIVLLNASNITPEKGQLDLLMAFQKLYKSIDNLSVIVSGLPNTESDLEKTYFEELKSYVKENNLEERVFLVGWQKEMGDLFEISDIYVHPSYTESLPVVIREAMGFGLPIVASNVGGTNELVKDGYNGFIFESGDINGLTNNLSKLIHGENKEMFKNNSRVLFENRYSLDIYLKNIRSLFKG